MLKKILISLCIVLLNVGFTYGIDLKTDLAGDNGGAKASTKTTNDKIDGPTDITSKNFTISVSDITPGGADLIRNNASLTIELTLKKTIERLIIALGTIALLVMTVGAGFIILYTGEDERLSKGKNIFTAGLIAIVVALLSGLMVQLVSYLLYI